MKRLGRKRWAFTLVEILVVLIILGILAGAMMLVSFSVTSKADATRIIEDMRSMKAAATLYYADYGFWPIWMKSGITIRDTHNLAAPDKYLESVPLRPDHWIGVAGASGDHGEATVLFVSTSVSSTTLQRLGVLGSAFPLYGMRVTGPIMALPENPELFDASTHNAALWYIRRNQ